MANILYALDICDLIPDNIKISIKLFHVFSGSLIEKNIIFATNEDKVYGLGSNEFGCLGFGHNNEVKECTEIKELSNHKIVDLYASVGYGLAKTMENKLFIWGTNWFGELGYGYKSSFGEIFKPFPIEFQNTEMIEDIKCGYYHTLVLLTNGLLYGWGSNNCNQLNLGIEMYCNPKRLTINGNELRFKFIYCFDFSSFAITTNGELFSWGRNKNGILGHEMSGYICVPKRVNLINVNKICSNGRNTYFLTNEGLLYFCGKYGINRQNSPKQMNYSDIMISDLPQMTRLANEKVICVDSKKSFYTLNGNYLKKFNENYDSIIELFAKRFQITPQTVHISSERPEHYFIIQNGIEVYPCDDKIDPDQMSTNLVEYELAKQDISINLSERIDELQLKFDNLESKVNEDNQLILKLIQKLIQKLGQNLKNETIRYNILSNSLLEAGEEIKELKLRMKNNCTEGFKDLIDKPK